MEIMLKIGELSELFGIPQQTLRYYDKIGLFSPAHINQETGYRYYTLNQLQQLHHIKILKSINISNSEIKELDSSKWNLNKLNILYSAQIDQIDQSIEKLKIVKEKMKKKQNIFRNLQLHPKNEIIFYEFEEDRTIYCKEVSVLTTIDQEEEYYKSFITLNSVDYINVSPGFIVEQANFLRDQFSASYLFLEDVLNVPEGFNEEHLPKGTYCSLYIEDCYSKSRSYYYEKFKGFIQENNINLIGDLYEFCYTVLSNGNDISSWGIIARINS